MKNRILMLCALLFSAFLINPTMASPHTDIDHQEAKLRSLKAQFESLRSGKVVAPIAQKVEIAKTVVDEPVAQPLITHSLIGSKQALPIEIQQLYKEKTELFSEMNRLHVESYYLETDNERFLNIARTVHLEAQLHEVWKNIHLYNETGAIPSDNLEEVKQSLADLSAKELGIKRGSAKSYISKNKHDPGKVSKVKERENLIIEIDKLIS
jgi:hypothetical protein